jgi:hypothetical protein
VVHVRLLVSSTKAIFSFAASPDEVLMGFGAAAKAHRVLAEINKAMITR